MFVGKHKQTKLSPSKMTAACILDVSYTLNPSGGKMVKVAIEVTDKCEVVVSLNKAGGRVLKMSTIEFELLTMHTEMISSFFESEEKVSPGSLLILNHSLRVRFDNNYKDKMVILERVPDIQGPRNYNTNTCPLLLSVYMMAKTWEGLVAGFPMLKYVIDCRQSWCPEVHSLLTKTVDLLQHSHAIELKNVKNLKDFQILLNTVDKSLLTLSSESKLDVTLCMHQLFLLCSQNLHILAITHKI
jgi:hypothetical protein